MIEARRRILPGHADLGGAPLRPGLGNARVPRGTRNAASHHAGPAASLSTVDGHNLAPVVAQQLSGFGRPFQWGMGAQVNGTQFQGAAQRYTSVVQVRKGAVRAYPNGQLMVEHRTDYSDLTPMPGWAMLDGEPLGLGSGGRPARFHMAELIVVTPAVPAAGDAGGAGE